MGSEQLMFEAYPPAHRHLDVVGTVGESVAMLRRAIQDADWSAVRTRSWQCLGLGCGALRTLALDDRHAAALDDRRVATRVAMIDRMQRAAGTAAGRVWLGEARAELERTHPEVAAALRALLDKLVTGDTSPLESATWEPRKPRRSVAHDLAIAARVRGVLGLVHGEFNAALAMEKQRTDPSSLHEAATVSVELLAVARNRGNLDRVASGRLSR